MADFDLAAYLSRIGLVGDEGFGPNLPTLTKLMDAQMRAISFENIDVVLGKKVSIASSALQSKIVSGCRGGYCFEVNSLLRLALTALGFKVHPLICRVRFGKKAAEITPFTHIALRVGLGSESCDSRTWLADVGFAGTNSIAPVALDTSDEQELPDGVFRIVEEANRYTTLQKRMHDGEWGGLYNWRTDEFAAEEIDLESANWWSCTKPGARFTGQFFASRTVGDERHHILNEVYVARKPDGTSEKTVIADKAQLVGLLVDIFGITLPEDTEGLDRYLQPVGA